MKRKYKDRGEVKEVGEEDEARQEESLALLP